MKTTKHFTKLLLDLKQQLREMDFRVYIEKRIWMVEKKILQNMQQHRSPAYNNKNSTQYPSTTAMMLYQNE